MAAGTITVPAFAGTENTIRHFFGTRLQPMLLSSRHDGYPSARPRMHEARVVVSVKQVHGTDALIVDRPQTDEATFPGEWDALVTNQPGVLLTIRTADCVPVLLHDPVHDVVAAVHAGWRGAIAGIVPKTLQLMRQHFQSDPARIRLVIGPSAGPCCYEVDEPVLKPLQNGYPYWRLVVRKTVRGKGFLDLKELLRRQARSVGMEHDKMWTVGVCTICHPQLFYSYRREGVVTYTMVSGIMLASASSRSVRGHRDNTKQVRSH